MNTTCICGESPMLLMYCVCVSSAEALSARRLRVEQDEPYGDMLIFPGTNYEDVHVTI